MKRFVLAALLLCVVGLFALAQAAPGQPALPQQLPGNAKPLVSGEFLSGTLWERPMGAIGPNSPYTPPSGSRVDVYDNFIVVTDSEGIAELSLHGSYTKLRFKPYR
jgi:hypothetical protein